MGNQGSFEDKIRQKLEAYEAPRDAAAWKMFRQTSPAAVAKSFWQLWYLPYLFSLLLFGIAAWWLPAKMPSTQTGARIDTLYVQQTVYVKDTLVIRDTLYIGNRSALQKQPLALRNPQLGAGTSRYNSDASPKQKSTKATSTPVPTGSNATAATAVDQSTTKTDFSAEPRPTSGAENTRTSIGQEQPNKENAAAVVQPSHADSAKVPTSPADTAVPPHILAGSAIDATPANEAARHTLPIFLSAGPRLKLFSPLSSGNFDTYFGSFAGGGLTLDIGRLTFDVGLQYGLWHNEFDDLDLLSPLQKSSFPAYNNFVEAPDEIEILSEHLLLPLQVGFELFDYRGLRTRLGAGLLGNFLLGESFLYNFTEDDETFRRRTTAGRSNGFVWSHFNAHIGLTYPLRQNLELQTLMQYFHPVREMGLSTLNPAAFSLQFGLNWVLLSR